MPIRPVHPVIASEPNQSLAHERRRRRPDPDIGQRSDEPAPPKPNTDSAPEEDSCDERQERDYEVGYKKPPKHTQFKKGRSGNPKGRPKAAKGLHSIVRDTLTKKVAVRTASGTKKISRIEAVLHKTVEQAMKGNARAMAELIKLYGNAVPDADQDQKDNAREEDLTATDLATLEELRRMMTGASEETQS